MVAVNVVYHHFPHYRAPIIRELAKHGKHDYRFWGDVEDVEGIKSFRGDDVVDINPLQFRRWGRWWLLSGYRAPLFDKTAKVLIVLGNPNMPSSAIIALVGRLLGKKVIFWAHGWLKKRNFWITLIRNFYFALADCVFVYNERAAQIAAASGFKRVRTIYNSLDFDKAQTLIAEIEADSSRGHRPQDLFSDRERPLLICTARLTALCRFDVLLHASALLAELGRPVNILLVGDGPEREALRVLAEKLGVSVHFYGACYDEDELSKLIYWSDVTISPGKIGLTAMHTLTYGTPAITHGNLDAQMPEVEAIEEGVVGAFFKRGDAADLARVIEAWLDRHIDRATTREACRKVIATKWNPANQRALIDQAIDMMLEPGDIR